MCGVDMSISDQFSAVSVRDISRLWLKLSHDYAAYLIDIEYVTYGQCALYQLMIDAHGKETAAEWLKQMYERHERESDT